MITLTVKNSARQLIDIHRDFVAAFKKLRRLKRWKHHIRGGIVSFELTLPPSGEWHYHAHIFAFKKSGQRYEQADLCADWEKSNNGAGRVTDIRRIDLEGGFREVVKYSFKPLDLMKNRFDAPRLRQFYELSKRSRLSQSFGEFYGFDFNDDSDKSDIDESDAPRCCQKCGEPVYMAILTRRELVDLRRAEHHEALLSRVYVKSRDAVFKSSG